METFADVLHHLIDVVLGGDTAEKAHSIIDRATGPRSEDYTAPSTPADTPSSVPSDSTTE